MSGHNMKSSVFAAAPCTNGSADKSAKSAAAIQAQQASTKRLARKKNAQTDAAENNNPTK
jgi:hypothetical protein